MAMVGGAPSLLGLEGKRRIETLPSEGGSQLSTLRELLRLLLEDQSPRKIRLKRPATATRRAVASPSRPTRATGRSARMLLDILAEPGD